MLPATQNDFKSAYHKHSAAYRTWGNADGDVSKRLILVYCVECGLKYLIMKREQLFKTNEADDTLAGILKTHDYCCLLKQLNRGDLCKFEHFKTKDGHNVNSGNFQELCRYNIQTAEYASVLANEAQLIRIEKWLYEEVV